MRTKKHLLSILILPILFLCGVLAGCKESDIEKVSKNLSTYTMEITYNDDHTLSVKQSLDYKNNNDTSLDSLSLHLYPRSFRDGSLSSVVSKLNYNKCYYNGASFGDINITSLKLNDNKKDIVLSGNDEDILEVKLDENLSPNSSVNLYIEYTVTLPNINHRFGYGEDTINVANFYPIMCMYEDGKYVIDSYHYNGDPFYSDVANYNVKISAPKSYTLASSGDVKFSNEEENNKIYNIEAKAVRDFAFILSDKYAVVSDNIDGVNVNYYYYKNQYPAEGLQASVDAVRTFNKLFGKYPYSTLNVCEAGFVHGGMEYPNLVFISDAVTNQSDYINTIVHEVGHQWWYGLVGNNEYQYGWLDEGLTEYSTLLFYEENPEYNVDTKTLIKNTTNSYVTFVEVYEKVFGSVDSTMNRKLNEYKNESEYVYIAYVKGMLIFDSLREIVGKDKILEGLQTYFENNKFKIATPDDLVNAFEETTKTDLKGFFSSWIDGKVRILQMN